MPFATGFLLLTPRYRGGRGREEVKEYLGRLGFELYEVGKEAFIVFYVEADSVRGLEEVIRAAERHEGVAKAYIVYGFMADDATREWINRALEAGELELDQTTLEYIRRIVEKLGGSVS